MSDDQDTPEVTDLGSIPGTVDSTEGTNLGAIPQTQVTPEDGLLSVRYTDGAALLVVTGGNAIPAQLTVVDQSGRVVASYTGAVTPPAARTSARTIPTYALSKDPENLAKLLITGV
ncbi:hypothetical protein [Streptomyces sp. IGB124]|uniref:hypothetical protein n=1 Tax=Streptomyces sp. IGB124 TaxID=1519485 RepID=UPI0006AF738A|nr:hypothetical protein [Streptomyces sp. IGB124]KOU65123.1 hypothetical protein ADK96_19095 [Streptomyces sp. IGB124]